ncbi:SAM-dependent methyltransferase [Citricoccus sp. SGAir0253]|uniref:class I SAM-dependent methyltransferase n=1 Tax=Citricoccus sp. SGAir0253 TaxID=2567881 RepID=UPI0010CCB6A1|nr:class I SAM-dependent methyltransferase [Citricoccus sp. SGAir0253]QCU78518.1 SAM-dependent methyltransferase [Citricoccus sp. SGAir0253]
MTDVPQRPRAHPRLDAAARAHLGGAFRRSGADYDAIRPSYPAGVVDFLLPAGARAAVDLGAGTGLFTALLAGRGLAVTAVDPSGAMLEVLHEALPAVRTVRAPGERTGLPEGVADLVTAAQAWHWIDPVAGTAEAARLLGGTRVAEPVLGIVSNQLDTSVPWVHRLSRIMHAGDVHPPRRPPAVGEPFAAPEGRWWHWTQPITPEGLHGLMATRSYHLRAGEAVRERMRANLDWYLLEHLGHAPGEVLALPYVTSAWRCVLRAPGGGGR